MKRIEPVSVGEALTDFFENRKLSNGVIEGKALELWSEVVGEYIMNATQDVYIRKQVIYVRVSSSVIRQDLVMRKAYIIDQINKKLGTKALINLSLR